MSIANEIARINKAKQNIATSIAKKGVPVPENAKIDEYSAFIDDIQGNIDATTKIIKDTVIAEKQFYQGVGLEGIKTVILPNVQTIGVFAFSASSEIETVDIGASVTSIDISAFSNCSSLKTLIFRGLLEQETAIMLSSSKIDNKELGAYIYVPDEYVEGYQSPTNKTLSRYTERIKSLKELGGGADVSGVTATAEDVLRGKKIVTKDGKLVAGTMPNRQAIAEVLGEGETITIPKGYHNGEGTVTAASIIKTIDATEIADSEYYQGKGLKGVKILNLPNVTKISWRAFGNATELQTIDIGASFITPNASAFDGCSNLTTVILRRNANMPIVFDFNDTPIGNKAAGAYIYVPDGDVDGYIANSANSQFKDQIKPLSELQSKVTLNITNVEANQFANLKCIKEFNLPYVEYVNQGAFVGSGIETLDIGPNVQDIPTSALNNMTQLSTLIIRGKPTQFTKLTLTHSLIWKGKGYIYVPDEYVEHFKTKVFTSTSPAPYNKVLADRVKPLSKLGGVADPTATNWSYFSHANHHNDRVAKLKYDDTANGIYFNSMCERSTKLEYIPDLNTSKGISFSRMCYDNKSLLKNPNIDTSNGKYFSYMHNCCSAMETTPQYNLSKGELLNFMYWNCHIMKDPVIADVPCGKNFEGFMYNSNMVPKVTLTNMNVDIVENTKGMFSGGYEVTEISGAVMGKNGGAAWMFRGCGKLQTIKGFKINPQAIAHASEDTSESYPMKGLKNVWEEAFEWCNELVTLEMTGENKWTGLNLRWCKKLSQKSILNVINTLSATTEGLNVTLSKTAVNKAFETSSGANDGSASAEWKTLIAEREKNWVINLEN